MSKQLDKRGDVCLTLRKNGKYWQIGYYDKSKWIQEAQLGTAEQVLNMVREHRKLHTNPKYVLKHNKEFKYKK